MYSLFLQLSVLRAVVPAAETAVAISSHVVVFILWWQLQTWSTSCSVFFIREVGLPHGRCLIAGIIILWSRGLDWCRLGWLHHLFFVLGSRTGPVQAPVSGLHPWQQRTGSVAGSCACSSSLAAEDWTVTGSCACSTTSPQWCKKLPPLLFFLLPLPPPPPSCGLLWFSTWTW